MASILRAIGWLFDLLNLLPFAPVLLVLFIYSRWIDNRHFWRREGIYRNPP
jgi:hypothetical protein